MKNRDASERSRKKILLSAVREIHRKGYNATSINDILAGTNLTKGALYHHFPNKQALGWAVLDLIGESIQSHWIAPLAGCETPLSCLEGILSSQLDRLDRENVELGCLLNNLAQEMSAQDEEFRLRVAQIYEGWRRGIAEALRRGQRSGEVKLEIDALGTATFVVASMAGMRGMAKTTKSADVLMVCADNLNRYIESLRTL